VWRVVVRYVAGMLGYDFPLLGLFFAMLWFFLWIVWLIILFRVIVDIFRTDDLGGWGKAGWLIFVVFLPYLGVFVYLIARGRAMGQRDLNEAKANDAAMQDYVRQVAGSAPSAADELAKLADLRDKGVLSDAEFAAQKARLLA
jgi:Short C-terminal domain